MLHSRTFLSKVLEKEQITVTKYTLCQRYSLISPHMHMNLKHPILDPKGLI